MSAGISRRGSSFLLLVLALASSLPAFASGEAKTSSNVSCPLRYEHANPHTEDGSAVALHLGKGQRLGSLGSGKLIDEQSISTVWQRCIDAGLPQFRDDEPENAAECIKPIALSFVEELRKLSRTIPMADRGSEALLRFRQKWRAIDNAISSDPLAVCAIAHLPPTNRIRADKFVVEVLNVMAVTDLNPAVQRGYLRAVTLDAQSADTVDCSNGCARLYWMRRILEK